MQVHVHQLPHHVHVVEVRCLWRQDIHDFDDIRVGQLGHDADFSPDFPGIDRVNEEIGAFLDGDFLARLGVEGGDDHAVGAAAELSVGGKEGGREGGEGEVVSSLNNFNKKHAFSDKI